MALSLRRLTLLAVFVAAIAIVLLGIAQRRGGNAALRLRYDYLGYWSPVTGTIDWCEPNYIHTPYVVEAWNAASSLVLSVPGLYLFRKSAKHKMHWPCWLQAFNLTCLGLGSALFHGTLTRWAQWLDEIPMFAATCTASAAYFAGVHGTAAASVKAYTAVWSFAVLLVFAAVVALPNATSVQVFQVAFILSILEMFRTAWLYVRACKCNVSLAHLAALIDCALIGGAIAALAWTADFCFCDSLVRDLPAGRGLSPHVIWHFAVAYGTHALSELGSFAVAGVSAQASLGTELRYVCFGIVPVLGRGSAPSTQGFKAD